MYSIGQRLTPEDIKAWRVIFQEGDASLVFTTYEQSIDGKKVFYFCENLRVRAICDSLELANILIDVLGKWHH